MRVGVYDQLHPQEAHRSPYLVLLWLEAPYMHFLGKAVFLADVHFANQAKYLSYHLRL